MTVWAVVNMIFLRGAPPPFSLTWQYEEAAAGKAQVATVDEETAGSSASLWKILQVPGLLQYSFSHLTFSCFCLLLLFCKLAGSFLDSC